MKDKEREKIKTKKGKTGRQKKECEKKEEYSNRRTMKK